LTVPYEVERRQRSGFHRDFVQMLNERTPHVIIVDARSPGGSQGVMRFARGARDYANWFVTFNDARAGAGNWNIEDTPLPPHHVAELRRWFQYTQVHRMIKPWIGPGPTYSMALWSPEPHDDALLGDFLVPRKDVEAGDTPFVVLANPSVYVTDETASDLHENLRGNRPYFFDGPEMYVDGEIRHGFGPHGYETRVEGPTTDMFVEAVQRYMKIEIERLLKEDDLHIHKILE
ncbi:MAG: hypothetical protein O3B84_08475, partial [Chloroflexi bacterium]|nr:hypothetical protein [Chloroflexota bacterium]